jgi:RNA polymerase sigma factor (TIGR02999 family)
MAELDRATAPTDLLKEARAGSNNAVELLLPLVYDELRAIAHRQLRAERADHTLGTTALVHEAYLRLVDQKRVDGEDRNQFFALAARVMRRVLVDYARRRGAIKRRALLERTTLDDAVALADQQADLVLAIDEALTRLSTNDARQALVVEYRFFAGLSEDETAALLGISARTVRHDWVKARGWLYRELDVESAE